VLELVDQRRERGLTVGAVAGFAVEQGKDLFVHGLADPLLHRRRDQGRETVGGVGNSEIREREDRAHGRQRPEHDTPGSAPAAARPASSDLQYAATIPCVAASAISRRASGSAASQLSRRTCGGPSARRMAFIGPALDDRVVRDDIEGAGKAQRHAALAIGPSIEKDGAMRGVGRHCGFP